MKIYAPQRFVFKRLLNYMCMNFDSCSDVISQRMFATPLNFIIYMIGSNMNQTKTLSSDDLTVFNLCVK